MNGESLTLKSLQTHLIKATITSAVSACIVAILLMVGFYYTTNNRVSANESDIKNIIEIQDKQGVDINLIKEKMSADNANAINFDRRLNAFEENQKETNKLLLQILQSQKRNNQ